MCVCVCVCVWLRLRLVFPWLATAFASQLDCRELLLLWDRVLGYDSLDIIASELAVAVVSFGRICTHNHTSLFFVNAVL